MTTNALARLNALARQTPGALAVVDETGTTTWASAASAIARAGGGLQAQAELPGTRWAVLGDNAAPTLLAHAAGLVAGVGTAALSKPAHRVRARLPVQGRRRRRCHHRRGGVAAGARGSRAGRPHASSWSTVAPPRDRHPYQW